MVCYDEVRYCYDEVRYCYDEVRYCYDEVPAHAFIHGVDVAAKLDAVAASSQKLLLDAGPQGFKD